MHSFDTKPGEISIRHIDNLSFADLGMNGASQFSRMTARKGCTHCLNTGRESTIKAQGESGCQEDGTKTPTQLPRRRAAPF